MTEVGIEKLHVYPTTLALSMDDLCRARGFDAEMVKRDFLVDERGVNPPWEDAVTMAVNAARPMLSDDDRRAVGLLIVGTETSVDNEKPVSSWVHRFLDLPADCRNFEVKHACYGATGGLQMALAWLASGLAGDRKALIVNADQSLIAPGDEPYETVMGACSAAILLSAAPRLVSYDLTRFGVHAFEVSDVFRPTPQVETGDGELSLLSYFDGLEGALDNYAERADEPVDAWTEFDWYVYHMPFAGMAERAHRALLTRAGNHPRSEIAKHFDRACAPSTVFARRMGGTYGASTFVGLLGLLENGAGPKAGDRVGIFAYGSGSCAELQCARFMADASAVAREAGLKALLDGRRRLDVADYDAVETERNAAVMAKEFVPDRARCDGLFDRHYRGKGKLVLEKIQGYFRHYGWS